MTSGVPGSKKMVTFQCAGCGSVVTKPDRARPSNNFQSQKCCSQSCARKVAATSNRKRNYQRVAELRAKGSPYDFPLEGVELLEFWSRVSIRKLVDCWPWKASLRKGSPTFWCRAHKWAASRIAWTIANGSIPPCLVVFHSCLNKNCLNPEHMYLGNTEDQAAAKSGVGIHGIPISALERLVLSWEPGKGKFSDCWEYTGVRQAQGYGQFTVHIEGKSRTFVASRVMFELVNGLIGNPKLQVCHTCDNPPCINYYHLKLGTAKDNGEDMSRRGRTRGAYLKPEQVLELLRLSETMSNKELAEYFDIPRKVVTDTLTGRSYSAITRIPQKRKKRGQKEGN